MPRQSGTGAEGRSPASGGKIRGERSYTEKKEVRGIAVDPRSIPKIARWSAAAAVAIVLVVAGIFAHRAWLGSQAMRHAPPAVPSSVEQRSLKFTFSKEDGQQIVFTIHAARATEFSKGNRSLLEDVGIVVYGEHGERHDEIQTRSCEYLPSTGTIECHGRVELELASAPVAGKAAKIAAGGIRIETSGVRFDRDSGEASTDAPVEFRFPEGQGSAIGVKYSSRGSGITLGRDVSLTLAPSRLGDLPTTITAKGGLSYNRKTGKLRLNGPVTITKGNRSLVTAALTVELNPQLRPEHALAGPGASVRIDQGKGLASFQADEAEVLFNAQGRASHVNATGHIVASQGPPNAMRLEAGQANVTLDPLDEQPRDVVASGGVRLESRQEGRTTRLSTDTLYLTGAPVDDAGSGRGTKTRSAEEAFRLATARSGGRAQVEWASSKEQLRLDAGRMAVSFDADNAIEMLQGSAGIRMERRQPGAVPVVTTADALRVHFSGGQWNHAEESGHVQVTQGAKSASAERGAWSRSQQRMELTGDVRLNEPSGQTLAHTIEWNQETGKLRASGEVRSTYFASHKGETDVAPSAGPANVVAETLEADPSAGEAVYSGGARLWQGDVMVQADRIELRRKSGELIATGNVLGAFPQASRKRGKNGTASKAAPGPAVLWRVRAEKLTYTGPPRGAAKTAEGKATLDGGVRAWSTDGQIDASRAVLALRRDAAGRAELAQATGEGGVLVRQGKRWGQAERALYDAEAGKFVLSGGKPSLHDTSGDLVTGDELTFYVADDTILIESSKGSRTLTRHPVPK